MEDRKNSGTGFSHSSAENPLKKILLYFWVRQTKFLKKTNLNSKSLLAKLLQVHWISHQLLIKTWMSETMKRVVTWQERPKLCYGKVPSDLRNASFTRALMKVLFIKVRGSGDNFRNFVLWCAVGIPKKVLSDSELFQLI